MDLLTLVDQFKATTLRENPAAAPDPDDRVVMFLHDLQSKGADMSLWTEDAWIDALTKLGVRQDDIPAMLEDVASWGMVDNHSWATPIEIKGGIE